MRDFCIHHGTYNCTFHMTNKSKKIGPMFKWFGSKWSGAKHYPTPIYDTIVEPFAGGAGYSLNYPEKNVVLYDSNKNVWALWEWLINYASYNPCAISEIPLHVPEGTDIRTLGLTTGQELLLKHWQRTNNVGECWTVSPWGNKPGQWTANTRARLTDQVPQIKHWVLLPQQTTFHIQGATYFIDPPYQYNYQYGVHGFNWKSLGESIANIPKPNQVIACEARCPKTGRMPDWLPFIDFRKQVTSRRKAENSHHSSEVIWLSENTN